MTRQPLIVILSSTAFDGQRLYDQRIATALAAQAEVLYVDPPLALGRRVAKLESTPTHERISVVRPRMPPFGRRKLFYPVTGLFVGIWIRWLLFRKRKHHSVIRYLVIASASSTLRVLPRHGNVHLVKDDYIAGASLIGIEPQLVAKRFFSCIKYADSVCVVSPHLQEVLMRRGVRSTIAPAGCFITDALLPVPVDMPSDPFRAAFIGMISDRIDFSFLTSVLAAGVSVVLVGPLQNTFTKHFELEQLLIQDTFYHLEPRTGHDLHAVLQNCHVGLIPYVQSNFNDSSFPLKAFEYLAAGLQIISTPLPAMAWLGHDVIRTESDAQAFARAARDACETHGEWASVCRAIAADNTWDRRAEVFADLLGLAR